MPQIFTLDSGYARKGPKSFRAARGRDVRSMPQQSRQYIETESGWRMVTITSVHTNSEGDVFVKWRYGLWQFGTSRYDSAGLVGGIRFLIECGTLKGD